MTLDQILNRIEVLKRFCDPKNNATENERRQAASLIEQLQKIIDEKTYDQIGDINNHPSVRISVLKIPKGVLISIHGDAKRAANLFDFVKQEKAFSLLAYSLYELDCGMKMAEEYFEITFNKKERDLIHSVSGLESN
jgi:hypothetical protein